MTDDWFVLREEYCWLVAGGWFVLREKYCWLVADKPSEQAECRARLVQLHERLHNFNSQTVSSLPSSLVSFSENSLSQS
jgi:hypothetical protein